MRIKHSFEVVNLDDDIVAVPVGESANELHGVLKLNKYAWEILDLLKEDITAEEIVKKLSEKYEDKPEVLLRYVYSFVEKIRSLGLLID